MIGNPRLRPILFSLYLVTAALLLSGCSGRDTSRDSLQRIKEAGVLRIAIDPTYPPMEFVGPDGKLVGFDVELGRALAEKLGVEVEFLVTDWSGIIAGLTSGRYDVIISSMNITEERQQQVAFVEYVRMSQVFLCRTGNIVQNEQDLVGKVVAVQTNTTSHTWVEEVKKKGVGVKDIKAFPGATDTFNSLKAGHADVIVTDEPVGRYYGRKNSQFQVTGQAMEPEPIGIAMCKEDRELQKALTTALANLRQDGTYQKLSERWFGDEAVNALRGGLAIGTYQKLPEHWIGGEVGRVAPEELGFWSFSWQVVLPRLVEGMWLTVQLTLWSGALGVVLGLLLALGRISRSSVLRWPVLVYITLFRGTPLLLQVLFIYFALPQMLGLRLEAMFAAVLALSLNAAAYVSEIMRAAIQSIDKGQMEAARALGMSHGLAMRRVILPQTYRRILPPLVNELAALSKDTSLVMVIALPELLFQTQRLAASYLRPWEVYGWSALGYLMIVLLLTGVASYLERHLSSKEA
jgi:polar amino acid transport system substrate-binding protein